MTTMEEIMEFYQHSDADILEVLDGEGAGTVWTFPACSPEVLKQAVRHLTRSKTTRIRWMRKVRLKSKALGKLEAVGIYIIPPMTQRILRLDTGEEIVSGLLKDECFATMQSFEQRRK